ncbi:protein kinase [Acrocarpospora sp. B8E8]|uniref:serine/threonine-protein kinase n=1 Tax=Acrocarpospora sp. B8E8 TaxID=3153572 RepID=UPI00325DD3E6
MTLLAERYRLISPIGQGGMGTVWHAMDELLRQEVAIKEVLLPPDLGEAQLVEMRERTLREARAAARLRSHPSIVTVHDVVLDGGRPWIIMELVRGQSLDKIVRTSGPLPPQRVAEIGLTMLDALNAAHSMGILHRDVKPGNVLITGQGRVLLTDFGIATVAGDVALTQTGLLSGSPGYMAPERLRGEPDGPLADLWSLGATLYTAVEGTTAFHRENPAAIMAAVLMHEPHPMRLAGPLAPVLAAILEKDPARRCPPGYAAAQFQAIAGGGIPTGPTMPAQPAPRRRSPAPLIVGGVLGVTLLAVTGVVVWRGDLIPSFADTPRTSSSATAPGTGEPSSEPTSEPTAQATPLLLGNPEACDLLTPAQARILLGGAVKRQFQTHDSCMWTGPGNTAFINLQKTQFTTMEVTQSAYDMTRATMEDEPKRYPATRLRATRTVGDATYSWTRQADGYHQTTVMFKTANVTASLYYSGPRPGFGTADRAAKLVNAAILAAH